MSNLGKIEKEIYQNSISIVLKNLLENDTVNQLITRTHVDTKNGYKSFNLDTHAAHAKNSVIIQKENEEPYIAIHKGSLFTPLLDNISEQDKRKNGSNEAPSFNFDLDIKGQKENFKFNLDTNSLWLKVTSPALVNAWNKMLEVKELPLYQVKEEVKAEDKKNILSKKIKP